MSRITRGIIEVKKEPLDLTAIVKAAVETSRPVLDSLRHEIRLDLAADQICVAGDAVRLTQVFANLLNNAAKYTNHGGLITIASRTENGEAVVSVKDNGIGIAPNLLAQVFDMFMQVDRSTRRSQGGLGIGLTLVKSLVTMHGGSVEARSEGPGLGSEFIVRLPLLEESAMPAEGQHDVHTPQGPRARGRQAVPGPRARVESEALSDESIRSRLATSTATAPGALAG